MFTKIKYFIQRGRRGYSDEDQWDVGNYLATIVPVLVRRLQKGHGCPSELFDKERVNDECHNWYDILEEIAQGFEAANEVAQGTYYKSEQLPDGKWSHEFDQARYDNLQNKAKRGLELFAVWYQNLWD